MKTRNLLLTIIFLSAVFSLFSQKQGAIYPTELTTEYLVDPTGLDVRQPRFSWKLAATNPKDFGRAQSAYRILVSSTKRDLDENKGNLWDTGWIPSDEMQLIEYKGKELESDQGCFWKVSVKDEKGNPSKFSGTASFTTGLFDDAEWTAKWIGSTEIYDPSKGSNKIYDPWFRKSFDLKQKPSKATLFVASVGYHEVYVNGQKIGTHVLAPAVTDHTQRARYIAYDIAPELKQGKNVIALWLGTSWAIYRASHAFVFLSPLWGLNEVGMLSGGCALHHRLLYFVPMGLCSYPPTVEQFTVEEGGNFKIRLIGQIGQMGSIGREE